MEIMEIVRNPGDRHPSIQAIMRWLEPNINLPADQYDVAEHCKKLAGTIMNLVPQDSPELIAGLRKLLEAKDCFVRASLEDDS
jgi:hypothetical protein